MRPAISFGMFGMMPIGRHAAMPGRVYPDTLDMGSAGTADLQVEVEAGHGTQPPELSSAAKR